MWWVEHYDELWKGLTLWIKLLLSSILTILHYSICDITVAFLHHRLQTFASNYIILVNENCLHVVFVEIRQVMDCTRFVWSFMEYSSIGAVTFRLLHSKMYPIRNWPPFVRVEHPTVNFLESASGCWHSLAYKLSVISGFLSAPVNHTYYWYDLYKCMSVYVLIINYSFIFINDVIAVYHD